LTNVYWIENKYIGVNNACHSSTSTSFPDRHIDLKIHLCSEIHVLAENTILSHFSRLVRRLLKRVPSKCRFNSPNGTIILEVLETTTWSSCSNTVVQALEMTYSKFMSEHVIVSCLVHSIWDGRSWIFENRFVRSEKPFSHVST